MTSTKRLVHIKVLREEVEALTKRLKPAGTGHIITAIGVINGRIDELIKNGMIDESLPPKGSRSMQEKYGRAVETVYNPSKEI
mgnify:CR=1 FL=1|jgi:hypothetical protein|tara:strand:- start:208 stop:456 length:249 start_codon:yes stop_codon:yes gene_type:complete